MIGKRILDLFHLLSENEYKTAEQFSLALGLSEKTIRKLLKDLNDVLIENGAYIESKSGYGYRLITSDRNKIEQFKLINKRRYLPETSQERIQYLLEYLLYSKDYVKCEDLSEMLFITKKTLANDLREVEKIMHHYNLIIDRKPYYGIKVIGREFDLRLCIAECIERKVNFNLSGSKEFNSELKEIAEIIMEAIDYKKFKISDMAFQNLIVHIHIAIKRIQENHYVPMENIRLDDYVGELEFDIAKMCADKISKRFNINFPQSEIEYIAIHLSGKKIFDFCKTDNGNVVIDQEINDIVNEMLQVIYEGFKFDFRNDLELIMSLGQHLVPLRVRMNFDMKMKNPLLKEIKERYSLPYAMAIQSSTVLKQRYNKELDEDEIGYIALILALALERQSKGIEKKNILLVCSSGKGSAQLLAYKLKDVFSEYINNIETCDVRSIKKYDFKEIDYVFTTVPISFAVPVPIQEVKYFFESRDIKAMRNIFEGKNKLSNITKYYSKDLFITNITFENKRDALKYMCDHIKKYKKIPEGFYDAVLKREKLAKTEFGNFVAMPHPNKTLTEETFVCVCILDKPILWDEQMIQVIFLVSIENKRNKQLELFYRITSKLLLNKHYINEIIRKKDYELLQNLLLKIEQEEMEGQE